MEESLAMQVQTMGSSSSQIYEMKRMLLETNPYLLGLTFAVTLLHTVFDFLAFKNDISFWKNKKSMEGLSARSILLNTFCQVGNLQQMSTERKKKISIIECRCRLKFER